VPLPLPLLPDVIVIQETLLLADQVHPLPALTEKLPLPPPAGMLGLLVGEIEYVQLCPAWFTV